MNRATTTRNHRRLPGRMMTLLLVVLSLLATVLVTGQPAAAVGGGSSAQPGDHPYLVSLQLADGRHSCGGVLISSNVVLTAAHCITGGEAPVTVRAGGIDRRSLPQSSGITRTVIHPNYRGGTFQDFDTALGLRFNDIAVLFLASPFTLNANVQTIDALSDAVETASAPGNRAVVAGWGAESINASQLPTIVRQADQSVIGDGECQNRLNSVQGGFYSRTAVLDAPIEICTFTQGRGPCFGDSGGPLAVKNSDGSATLIGLVAWGPDCTYNYVSGVYLEVARFRDWISQTTGINPPAPIPTPTPQPTATPQPTPTLGPIVDGPFTCSVAAGAVSWPNAGQGRYWVYRSVDDGASFQWLGRTLGATSFVDQAPVLGATYQVHYAGIPRTLCDVTAEPGVTSLPGQVKAESYVQAVDTEAGNQGTATQFVGDADVWRKPNGNGFIVGRIRPGESTTYKVSVASSGSYRLAMRAASGIGGGTVTLRVDGQQVGQTTALGTTGSWWNFTKTDIGAINLTAGLHDLTVEWGPGQSNFDSIIVSRN